MGKWMSAVLVVSLSGCGLGVVSRAPDGMPLPGAVLDAPLLAQLAPVARAEHILTALPREDRTPKVRDDLDVAVKVTGVLGGEGKTLSVLVGQAGCGFSVHATGKAKIVNGVAHVAMDTKITPDTELTVMLVLDSDGDGKCADTDPMWSSVLITGQSDLTLAIDLSTAESGFNWMCFVGE